MYSTNIGFLFCNISIRLCYQAFTDNTQGLVNCILYFYYTKKIKRRLSFNRLFGTTRKLPFAQKLSSSTAFRARFHVNPLADDDVIYSITDHNETEERRLIHWSKMQPIDSIERDWTSPYAPHFAFNLPWNWCI